MIDINDKKNNIENENEKDKDGKDMDIGHNDIRDKIEDDDDRSHVLSPKSERKHGLFHKHCKDCEEKEAKCGEYKAGWQRAQADYQNLKKEIENMRGEWARYSEQQILEEFIPVLDNFRKAFNIKDTEDADTYADDADNADAKRMKNWRKGIEMIMKQFEKVLKDHGVQEIKTVGEIFNPELHEALAEEESDLPEHTVLKEVETGYLMRGKVIKVAKVIVSKKVE